MAVGGSPFRFETILQVRYAARDARRAQLATILKRIDDLGVELQRLSDEMSRSRDSSARSSSASFNLASRRDHDAYLRAIVDAHGELVEARRRLEVELAPLQAALREADTQVKVLEKLAERDAAVARAASIRAEAMNQDEAASARFYQQHSSRLHG